MNIFGKVFHGLGHAFAWLFHHALPAAALTATAADQIAQNPLVGLLVAKIGPQGEAVQADIHAAVGALLAAKDALGTAFGEKFTDLTQDQVALQSVERLYALLKSAFA